MRGSMFWKICLKNQLFWRPNRGMGLYQSMGRASDFLKIGGPKWPLEQKQVGHFLKWWAQAYQTNHSRHLGSILYLHTDTYTCLHICILTADYTVKPVLSGHSKKKTNYCLMQVLQPSSSYHLLFRSLFCLFLSGCLWHILLYWQPTCTFCFVEFVDSLLDEYFL